MPNRHVPRSRALSRAPAPRTIYVVEDDDTLLRLLGEELEAAGLQVRGFASAEAFLAEYSPDMTGCLVLDMMLPGMDGMTLLTELTRRGTLLPVVAISGFARTPVVVRAMRVGAIDFLEKPLSDGALTDAIELALRWASTGPAAMRRDAAAAAARVARLTARERSVFNAFAEGASTKQVAALLVVSPKTVETYRVRLLDKLAVTSPYALVRLAVLSSLFGAMTNTD